ncbi:hypothetical protein SeLEV6574_g06369 [Synchytrium endobioticum]|uniref:Uncharacterized protein n=1 Tax=Synchytrium endobioticum TaxID=286115 RepID=A0A507CP06_9FUNG|nr:hypothetical protein SeLEV6574_g06369 [Synchytrium endobioticum]
MRHSIIVIILLYAVTAAFAPGIRINRRSVWNLTPDVLNPIKSWIEFQLNSVMLEIQILNAPSLSASSISSDAIISIVQAGNYPRLPILDALQTSISFDALTSEVMSVQRYSVLELEIIALFHELILVCIDRDSTSLSTYYARNERNPELDPQILSRRVALNGQRQRHEPTAEEFRRAVVDRHAAIARRNANRPIESPPILYGTPVNPGSIGMNDAWSQNPFGSLPDTRAGSPVRDGSDMPLSPDSFGSTQMIDYTPDYR